VGLRKTSSSAEAEVVDKPDISKGMLEETSGEHTPGNSETKSIAKSGDSVDSETEANHGGAYTTSEDLPTFRYLLEQVVSPLQSQGELFRGHFVFGHKSAFESRELRVQGSAWAMRCRNDHPYSPSSYQSIVDGINTGMQAVPVPYRGRTWNWTQALSDIQQLEALLPDHNFLIVGSVYESVNATSMLPQSHGTIFLSLFQRSEKAAQDYSFQHGDCRTGGENGDHVWVPTLLVYASPVGMKNTPHLILDPDCKNQEYDIYSLLPPGPSGLSVDKKGNRTLDVYSDMMGYYENFNQINHSISSKLHRTSIARLGENGAELSFLRLKDKDINDSDLDGVLGKGMVYVRPEKSHFPSLHFPGGSFILELPDGESISVVIEDKDMDNIDDLVEENLNEDCFVLAAMLSWGNFAPLVMPFILEGLVSQGGCLEHLKEKFSHDAEGNVLYPEALVRALHDALEESHFECQQEFHAQITSGLYPGDMKVFKLYPDNSFIKTDFLKDSRRLFVPPWANASGIYPHVKDAIPATASSTVGTKEEGATSKKSITFYRLGQSKKTVTLEGTCLMLCDTGLDLLAQVAKQSSMFGLQGLDPAVLQGLKDGTVHVMLTVEGFEMDFMDFAEMGVYDIMGDTDHVTLSWKFSTNNATDRDGMTDEDSSSSSVAADAEPPATKPTVKILGDSSTPSESSTVKSGGKFLVKSEDALEGEETEKPSSGIPLPLPPLVALQLGMCLGDDGELRDLTVDDFNNVLAKEEDERCIYLEGTKKVQLVKAQITRNGYFRVDFIMNGQRFHKGGCNFTLEPLE
jgi:hypothetical protein